MSGRTNIGGQAVIEGVMMRGPKKVAVAVRKPDGEIEVKVEDNVPLSQRNKFFSLPLIRGAVGLIDSLTIGIKTLTYSASFYEDEDEESEFDKFLKRKLGDKAESFIMGFALMLSFVIAFALFFALPTLAANVIKKISDNSVLINLVEGIIRLIVFLIYIFLISKMRDIQRVFEYHGAEHKSIFCYEAKVPLTPENASKYGTLHPRCGTNFLLIVMIISIIFFGFLGWPNLLLRIISRIVFLPLIAGISYELIKWFGKSNSPIARILSYPGLMLQKLTTREPDARQLEVAIAALKAVIPEGDETTT
ncbi:membrane protein [Fervidicella metallireducens AeB]|uniref:Membrane protein n=1 Tax=Fervidicella metallireducens AeB TaxID=1403537 RepID=A0A017RYZ1_9CLOT|nr:DUF1385 domain-containing protein [Fervidicella metallireducens]EYE89811.1 membrane protein [Fervidicella metallireducens AeB]